MATDDSFRTLIEAAFPQRSDDIPGDDLIASWPRPAVGGRADCCPANAAVCVALPGAPGRESRMELLLCAHHYRASHVRLAGAGASVFDSANRLICGSADGAPADLWPPA